MSINTDDISKNKDGTWCFFDSGCGCCCESDNKKLESITEEEVKEIKEALKWKISKIKEIRKLLKELSKKRTNNQPSKEGKQKSVKQE